VDRLGHAITRLIPIAEVEVKPATQQPLRQMSQAEQGILQPTSEESPPQALVIKGYADVQLPLYFRAAPEVHVVTPASEEKLPLQVGQLPESGSRLVLEPGVLERYEEGGNDAPFAVFEGEQQVKRLLGVLPCLAREA